MGEADLAQRAAISNVQRASTFPLMAEHPLAEAEADELFCYVFGVRLNGWPRHGPGSSCPPDFERLVGGDILQIPGERRRQLGWR